MTKRADGFDRLLLEVAQLSVKLGEKQGFRRPNVTEQYRVLVTHRPRYGCRACEEAVVQAPDPLWEEVGVAFVQARPDAVLDLEELRSFARSLLANYKVPKRFVPVEQMPELPNGKFNKVLLREQARELAESGAEGPG